MYTNEGTIIREAKLCKQYSKNSDGLYRWEVTLQKATILRKSLAELHFPHRFVYVHNELLIWVNELSQI